MYHNPEEQPTLNRLRRTAATEMLFHHRFPTSTDNMRTGCHPYSTRKNRKLFKHEYILVHNGVLSNHHTLKTEHETLGIKYISEYVPANTTVTTWTKFNDSEALLYDVALYLDGQQTEVKARGSIAFVVIEKNSKGKPIKLHWAHNSGNPLKLNHHQGKSLTIASEGGGDDVPTETLFTMDYKTGVISSKPLTLTTAYAYPQPQRQAVGGVGGVNGVDGMGFQPPRTAIDNPTLLPSSTANPSSTYTEYDDEGNEQFWIDGGYYDPQGAYHQVPIDEVAQPQGVTTVEYDAVEYLETLAAEYPKDTLAKQLRRTERALERAQFDIALLEDAESQDESVVNQWMADYEANERTINSLQVAIDILLDEIADEVRQTAQKGATR